MTTEAAMTPTTTPGTPAGKPRQQVTLPPALSLGLRPLLTAAAASIAVGALLIVLAALVQGSAAATTALIGAGIAVGIFTFGAFVVHVASSLVPGAALLVALVTYAGQMVLVFALFIALSRPGGAAAGPERGWLAAAVIACTLVWSAAQILINTRQRIPIYDLDAEDGSAASPRGEK